MSEPNVPVFHTSDQALLPLATLALDREGIEYAVERPPGMGVAATLQTDTPFVNAGVSSSVLVRPEDERRARDLLADLESPRFPPPPPLGPSLDVIELASGLTVGQVTERQAQFLIDQLEEEDATRARYYIDAATIELLEGAGAEAELMATLRRVLGSQEGVEIHVSDRGLQR